MILIVGFIIVIALGFVVRDLIAKRGVDLTLRDAKRGRSVRNVFLLSLL